MKAHPSSSGDAAWTIHVECAGFQILPGEIACEADGRLWRFFISPERKRGKRFHLGLFVNGAAHSPRALDYPREKRACALLESPINDCYRNLDELADRFPMIGTHQQDLVERGQPFEPVLFGTNWISVSDEEDARRVVDAYREKTRLVSFVGSVLHVDAGAYRFRREAAEYVRTRGGVDCYGKGIREIAGKAEGIGLYRFSIAMENAARDHYFSEKLIDCVLLETVPIYYGCPGIARLLDGRGMLPFSSMAQLKTILDRLTPALYLEMRPFLLANRRAVLEHGWHSHSALLARLAASISRRYDLSADWSLEDSSERWTLAAAVRRALRRFRRR